MFVCVHTFKTDFTLLIFVTPYSELVVAPAGYNLTALTNSDEKASFMSSTVVLSVKYNVIYKIVRVLQV